MTQEDLSEWAVTLKPIIGNCTIEVITQHVDITLSCL